MFAPAQAVVEHKCTSAGSCDADTKTTRCLGAWENGTCKIGHTVPLGRDWQTLTVFSLSFALVMALMSARCPHNQFTGVSVEMCVDVMWCLQECL